MWRFHVAVDHRLTLQKVWQTYGTPEAAFNAGDFTAAYRLAHPSSETRRKAAVLCGLAEEALKPDVALDTYGQLARSIISCAGHHAKKQRIVIMGTVSLQILPYFKRVPGFEVVTAGFADHYDIRLHIEDDRATLQAKLGHVDLAISLGAEELSLPTCYGQLPFPKLALFLDSDLTLTSKHAQMQAMDALITFTSTDHFEVKRMYGRPTFTLPCFTYTPDAVKVAASHRSKGKPKVADVLFTGYARDPFFQRKAKLLFLLAMLPDHHHILINHNTYRLSLGEYLDRLGSAYLVPTFIRWQGAMNTRAMEALAVGSRVLVQRDGYMTDFLGNEADGLHDYDYATLTEDIETALKIATEKPQPERDEKLQTYFESERMAGYFLKCCAFLVEHFQLEPPVQQRSKLPLASSGMAFENESDRAGFNRHVTTHGLKSPDLRNQINACIASIYNVRLGAENAKSDAFATCQKALEAYPNSLLLHFHAGRVAYHYSSEPASAMPHFQRIIDAYDSLEFDPISHDIGNGMLIENQHFPYMLYLDVLIKAGLENTSSDQHARTIIASAAAMYLAIIFKVSDPQKARAFSDQAITLEPQNWCAHAHRVELLQKSPGAASALIESYQAAVEGFPFLIHDLIVPALQALLQLEQQASARELLQTWFRFYRRMRYNFECLPLPNALVTVYQKQPELFPEVSHKVFQLLGDVPANLSLENLPNLEPFEADVLTANLKTRFGDTFAPTDPPSHRSDLAPLLLYASSCQAKAGNATQTQALLTAYFASKPALPELTKALQLVRELVRFYPEPALNLYQLLIDHGFDRTWLLYFEMAECHERIGNATEALAFIDRALDIFPDFIKAQKKRIALSQRASSNS